MAHRFLRSGSQLIAILLMTAVCLLAGGKAWAGTTLSTPTLASPANGATGVTLPVKLAWNAVANATVYLVQVSSNTAFSTATSITLPSLSASLQVPSMLQAGTLYYWRVRAEDSATASTTIVSSLSNWSAVWSFTTAKPAPPPPAPTLTAPANGATGVARPVTVTWNAVANATVYLVQVSPDTAFNTATSYTFEPATTSVQVGLLKANTLYCWRVRAVIGYSGSQPTPLNPVMSDWSTVWSFTTAKETPPAPPAVPTLLSPANGATGVTRPVTLTWNAVANATCYLVQVAPDTSFNTATSYTFIPTTTTQQVSSLKANTLYYWRVRAVAGTSALMSAWSAAWSFTTAKETPPAPPAVPTLLSPTNGASGVARPVTLTWNTVASAVCYIVQVSPDTAFNTATVYLFTPVKSSQQLPNLKANTPYYWRVASTGSYTASATPVLIMSAWSTVWSFTTAKETPPQPPAMPTLLSPANGATDVTRPVTLTWNAVSSASCYLVQVASDTAFNTATTYTFIPTTTSQQVSSLKANTLYYWRARAVAGSTSMMSAWSTVWSFTTAKETPPAPPAAPMLISPTNGATGLVQPVTLTWNAVSSAYCYTVQVSIDTAFSTAIAMTFTTRDTRLQTPPLRYGTLHYWHVRALSSTGIAGSWSAEWSFTTFKPAAPALISPINGATGLTNPITLTWNAVSGAYASAYCYYVMVAPDTTFNTATSACLATSATKITLPAMKAGATFYWRVCVVAGSTCGTAIGAMMSDWSTVWSFTTAKVTPPAPPAIPTLISPTNGATGVARPVTLTWHAVSSATCYLVQVAPDTAFNTATSYTFVPTTASQQVSYLKANTLYYWRVRAVAGSSILMSDWSTVWSFTTAKETPPPPPAPPAVPTLTSPTNGTTGVARPVTLTWNAVSGATCYLVQVSPGNNFTGTATIQVYPTTAQSTLSQLNANTVYYWRVRSVEVVTSAASGQTLMSDWSSVWSFTTAGSTPTPALAAPVLTAPATGALNIAQPVKLTWQGVTNATSYLVEVAVNDNTFSTLSVSQTVTTTAYQLHSLPVAVYYWRVKAFGANGTVKLESPWSTIWSFTPAKAY